MNRGWMDGRHMGCRGGVSGRSVCHRGGSYRYTRFCRSRDRRMLAGSPQRSLGRCFLRGAFRIGSCLGVSDIFQMMADFFGSFDGDRTGVSLFLGYAKSRKKVNDGF